MGDGKPTVPAGQQKRLSYQYFVRCFLRQYDAAGTDCFVPRSDAGKYAVKHRAMCRRETKLACKLHPSLPASLRVNPR